MTNYVEPDGTITYSSDHHSGAMTGWPYAPVPQTKGEIAFGKVAGEQEKRPDLVSHPPHYTQGKYEVIDVMEDWFPTDPLLFQVGQYLGRCLHKGQFVVDLEKAIWMIRRRIANYERDGK